MQTLAWRQAVGADDAMLHPPPGHADFEKIYQAGPVGRDADGHPVIVERVGRVPAKLFCSAYNEDSLTPHILYNKEAARALCRRLSHEAGRRLYKVTVVVDFKGLGMQHASGEFLRLFKAYANRFSTGYPEFMNKCYVINAPGFVTGLWQVVRNWLAPEIVAKVEILGGEASYGDFFAKRGIVFDTHLESSPISWLNHPSSLELACSPGQLPRSPPPPPFLPPEDRAHLPYTNAADASPLEGEGTADATPPCATGTPAEESPPSSSSSSPTPTSAPAPAHALAAAASTTPVDNPAANLGGRPASPPPSPPLAATGTATTGEPSASSRDEQMLLQQRVKSRSNSGGGGISRTAGRVRDYGSGSARLANGIGAAGAVAALGIKDSGSEFELGFTSEEEEAAARALPPASFPTLGVALLDHPDGARRGEAVSRLEPNSREASPFETRSFSGKAIMLLRPAKPSDDLYYQRRVFRGQQRRMELQVQGRFKTVPGGTIYFGPEMGSFNAFSLVQRTLAKLVVSFTQRRAPASHMAMGDHADTQLPHFVAPLWSAADLLIVTPPGDTPPKLGQRLEECDGVVQGRRACANLSGAGQWNTSDTYTFTFNTRFLDMPAWRAVGIGADIHINSFWPRTVLRLAVYESSSGAGPHLLCENNYLCCVQVTNLTLGEPRRGAAPKARRWRDTPSPVSSAPAASGQSGREEGGQAPRQQAIVPERPKGSAQPEKPTQPPPVAPKQPGLSAEPTKAASATPQLSPASSHTSSTMGPRPSIRLAAEVHMEEDSGEEGFVLVEASVVPTDVTVHRW